MSYNRLILLSGAGTTGTSLLAGVLRALGSHVPQPETGAAGAPRGFGEPQWVADLHSRLLRQVKVQTADARPSAWALAATAGREPTVQSKMEHWLRAEFNKGDHVVVKDSRLAWFIPAWRRAGEVMSTPCFLAVLRHPLDVITSDEAGYGERWHPNARTAGWINSMLYTERATRDDRRAFVRHDDLVTDAMQTVAQLSEEVELELVERPTPPEMRVATSLIEAARKGSRPTWSSLEVDHRLVELAEDTYKTLDQAIADGKLRDKGVQERLDAVRQRYIDLYAFAETTAQFSIAAGGRGGVPGKPATAATPRQNLSSDSMRKALRRAKKKGKQTVHKLRERRSGSDANDSQSYGRGG